MTVQSADRVAELLCSRWSGLLTGVTILENSQVAERSWVTTHSNHAPYAIGRWYRPPAPGEVDTILQLHAANAVGCLVLGDLNVHHRKC